jgi:hypothetical protein
MKRRPRMALAQPWPKRGRRVGRSRANWNPPTMTWRRTSIATAGRAVLMRHMIIRHQWSPRFNLRIEFKSYAPRLPRLLALPPLRAPAILWRHSPGRQSSIRTTRRALCLDRSWHLENRTIHDVAAYRRTISATFHQTTTAIRRHRSMPSPALHHAVWLAEPARPPIHLRRPLDAVIPARRSPLASSTRYRVNGHKPADQSDMVFARSELQLRRESIRTPELVWRSEAQGQRFESLERSSSVAISPVPSLGAAASAPLELLPSSLGSPVAGMLDSALIERVADNVIGRVERRIRIERERRGA